MSYKWKSSIEQRCKGIVIGQSVGKDFCHDVLSEVETSQLKSSWQCCSEVGGFFPQNKEVWCGQFGLNCYLVAFEKVGVIFGYESKHAESKRGMKTSQFF